MSMTMGRKVARPATLGMLQPLIKVINLRILKVRVKSRHRQIPVPGQHLNHRKILLLNPLLRDLLKHLLNPLLRIDY